MGTIKKSVKRLVYDLLKEKGELPLKKILEYVQAERENVHPAHVRGVLNNDVKKGGKYFTRTARGTYSATTESTEEEPLPATYTRIVPPIDIIEPVESSEAISE